MKKPVMFGILCLGCASVAHATPIVDYDFNANPYPSVQPTNVAATTVATGVTTTPVNSGTGTGGVGAGNGGGTNGTGLLVDYTMPTGTTYTNDFLRAATNSAAETTLAQSVAAACYWNFVITPQAGAAMNFSDISITGARGGASTPRGFYIESSIDNPGNTWGTTTLFGVGSEQSTRTTTTTYNVGNYTTFLSPAASAAVGSLNLAAESQYQNVTAPVEFRVYVVGPASGNSIDFLDFSVNGTVTGVPEPATLGMLGIGSVGLLIRRRA